MRTLFLLCLLAVVGLFSGCNGSYDYEPRAVTLTYANWNLGPGQDDAIERQMIQAFMDEHSHIAVFIDESIQAPWLENLIIAASGGVLPDVFLVDDIGGAIVNGLVRNITHLAQTDDDFFELAPIVQETVMLSGAVYAVPFAKHIHGYFVNRDLFADIGMTPPGFGVAAGEFLGAVHAVSDLSIPVVGLNQAQSFVDWYPSAINSQLGFFAFDVADFRLNGPELLEAVRIAAELLVSGHTFYGLDHDWRTTYFPVGYGLGAFREEQMAFFYGGSWHIDRMINQAAFDWDFIGVPGGRSVVTLEVIGVSSATQHPEEAYLLARWMGHGVDGNAHRMVLHQEHETVPEMLPVTQNSQVLEALWDIMPVQGLIDVYAAMDRALIDGLRVMPGYMQARFAAPTGIEIFGTSYTNASIDALLRYTINGYANFADHSYIADEIAQQQLDIAQGGLSLYD